MMPKHTINRSIAYENKGDYDRAIKDFDAAIRLNPNDAEAYNKQINRLRKQRGL
jgi:tetratricopeptide (TPR) repeat protein